MRLPSRFKRTSRDLPQVKSWSYSAYSTFKKCPLQLKLKRVDRIPEPPRPATDRGTALHDASEKFVQSEAAELPKELSDWKERLVVLANTPDLRTETDLAFTREWEQCGSREWNRCWVRMKLDVRVQVSKDHVQVIDYKTGKIYDDHEDQAELYALGEFMAEPRVDKVDASMWYFDQSTIHHYEYGRDDVKMLFEKWHARGESVTRPQNFLPKPGKHCNWCAYSKKAGGPCQY